MVPMEISDFKKEKKENRPGNALAGLKGEKNSLDKIRLRQSLRFKLTLTARK